MAAEEQNGSAMSDQILPMFEHVPRDLFVEDLIAAHLASEVGRGELTRKMKDMFQEIERKGPALAEPMRAALAMAPSDEVRDGASRSTPCHAAPPRRPARSGSETQPARQLGQTGSTLTFALRPPTRGQATVRHHPFGNRP